MTELIQQIVSNLVKPFHHELKSKKKYTSLMAYNWKTENILHNFFSTNRYDFILRLYGRVLSLFFWDTLYKNLLKQK